MAAHCTGRWADRRLPPPSLYSPVGWFSWADAAEMYEQAQKAPDLMKGFVNTVLGLTFEEEAEAPEWQRLYERRETYRIGLVPEQGLFLTAGSMSRRTGSRSRSSPGAGARKAGRSTIG